MKQITSVGGGLIDETPALIAARISAAASMEACFAGAAGQGGCRA